MFRRNSKLFLFGFRFVFCFKIFQFYAPGACFMKKYEYEIGGERSNGQRKIIESLLPESYRSFPKGQVPASEEICLERIFGWENGIKSKGMSRCFSSDSICRRGRNNRIRFGQTISLILAVFCCGCISISGAGEINVTDYPSIHEAISANPGRVLYVPCGDYVIDRKISLRNDNSGLIGSGRIIQNNPGEPIIEIENVENVTLRDLTLTRSEGKTETGREAVLAIRCEELKIENLRVLDNRTRSAAVSLRDCNGARIQNCLVRNYMKIDVDDRTNSPNYGYAFYCIDGTGISVRGSTGTVIRGNRVIERNLLPTPEIKECYKLGTFSKKNAEKGKIISPKTWDEEYVNNWHQGSAIIVTSPETSDRTLIVENVIENAAQGIDLHCDHVVVANNIVSNSFMGMKAMHGSKNVLIVGNQFIKNDLWSIGLMPGASSHDATQDEKTGKPVPANCDGGSIIANNIISDFGYGDSHWIWGDNGIPIKFDFGQLPHNPPLRDVVVTGNIVYDTGRESGATATPPRYRYAVGVPQGEKGPKNIRFSGNLFHSGTAGISNVEIAPD